MRYGAAGDAFQSALFLHSTLRAASSVVWLDGACECSTCVHLWLHSCQAVAEVGCLNCGGRVAAHGVAECNVCGVICDTTCRVSWKELLLPCLVQFGMACAG